MHNNIGSSKPSRDGYILKDGIKIGSYNFTVDDTVRIYSVRIYHWQNKAYSKREKQYSFGSFGQRFTAR